MLIIFFTFTGRGACSHVEISLKGSDGEFFGSRIVPCRACDDSFTFVSMIPPSDDVMRMVSPSLRFMASISLVFMEAHASGDTRIKVGLHRDMDPE